jgi:hypothetical protein
MNIRIRPATPTDIPILRELIDASSAVCNLTITLQHRSRAH